MPVRLFAAMSCVLLLACNATTPQANATMSSAGETTAAAVTSPTPRTTVDDGVDEKLDGAPVTIKLPQGKSLDLRGFKIDAKHGLSAARCGVTIGRQRVMTMGVEDTGVYTCDALAAAGVLPADGQAPRIGLIYDVSSTNATFRTAVVLREGAGGWAVDGAFAGRFDDTPAGRSIPALRRVMR